MSISARITSYLDEQDIKYDTINHLHTNTAAGTALTAHIPPNSMAKAVVLEDHDSRHLMAILPADHKVSLHKLNDTLGLDLHLVDEEQVYHMFSDCDQGAVPAIGQAYNMNSIYDEAQDLAGLRSNQELFGKIVAHMNSMKEPLRPLLRIRTH